MNYFEICYKNVIKKEGGYVNDPDDAGGMTYKGISRKHNPKFGGWAVVDNYLKVFGSPNSQFKFALDRNEVLQNLVKKYYKTNYWDVLNLDKCKSFKVCNQLFDMCVNAGKSRAIKLAQSVLGMEQTGVATEEFYTKLFAIKN